MRKIYLLTTLCVAKFAFSANIPITVIGATETQIGIKYVAPTTAACTLTATDNNNGPSVVDLDATKFTGANSDLSRTLANGFLWPTTAETPYRREVFIGGHDRTIIGLDAKWYSLALQANTDHTINLTCGSDSGTVHAKTANIPLASYYPEAPLPVLLSSPLSGLPQPTDVSKYNDSISGVLVRQMTSSADNFDDTNPFSVTFLPLAIDVNNSGQWTNPNNFVTNQSSVNLASTSSTNAPLFAAFTVSQPGNEVISDLLITPYGKGLLGTELSSWCLSINSGQSCTNYTPRTVTFSTTARCQPTGNCSTNTLPATIPSADFSAWGGMKGPFGTWDLQNQVSNGWTVSASGSTVTIDQAGIYPGFNLNREMGSKVHLSGCTSGTPPPFLTVQTMINDHTMTVAETGLSLTGCAYQDYSVGIRVMLTNAGTLSVSVQGNSANGAGAWMGRSYLNYQNGSYYQCARQKVTITKNCAGVTQSPAISGYLCSTVSNNNIYILQDDGVSCQQSSGYGPSGNPHIAQLFRPIASDTFIGKDFGGNTWKLVHTGTDFTALPIDPHHTAGDRFTYTNISATNPITPQVLAAGGTVAAALNTGLWNPLFIDGIVDNGSDGSSIQYRTQLQSEGLCMLVWADALTNTLTNSLAMYGGYPFSTSDCHFGPEDATGYSVVGAYGFQHNGAPVYATVGQTLGGPFLSNVAAIKKGATYHSWPLVVTAVSGSLPMILTSTAHDLSAVSIAAIGTRAQCAGFSGNYTALNGVFYAHKLNSNQFSLYLDAQGSQPTNITGGGPIGSPTCFVSQPLYSVEIQSVINSGGNARLVAKLSSPGYAAYFPSGQLIIRDGDPITIVQSALNSTQQYYAVVTGLPAGQFDVYTNAALTTHASFASLSGVANWFAIYAETCPDPATTTLPGPQYMDTGFGTTGAGNQKVRCATLQLSEEPESYFASSAEHAGYPPPVGSAEASDLRRSMLHSLNVGDGLATISDYPDQNHELLYVLSVDRSGGANSIVAVVERNYGDDPGYLWRGSTNGPGDTFSLQKPPGWIAWQEAVIPGGLVSTFTPTQYLIPTVSGSHHDTVTGDLASTITTAQPYFPSSPDDFLNASFSTFSSPVTTLHSSLPFWLGGSYQNSPQQGYPSRRTIVSQANANELVWKNDWMAQNPSVGQGQNASDNIGWARSFVSIRGTQYDAGNTTTHVFTIATIGVINTKVSPILVHALPNGYYTDKSGPGSLITDADVGKYCVAYLAGECRPNSSQWNVFVSILGYFSLFSDCRSNDVTLGSPCAFGLWPGAGWAIQARMSPRDNDNNGVRRLTQALWLPPSHYSFSNWVASPDGRWGFFVNNPVNQRSRKGLAEGSQMFYMSLPPFPSPDTITRTGFVQVPVTVTGNSGDQFRIRFWYGENTTAIRGCTSRIEACWTTATPTLTNPYLFASEVQVKTTCSSTSCKIPVPAIPGRILFYMVERTTTGGLVSLGPKQAVLIP